MTPETNLTEYGGGSYQRESESLHAEMYRFHYAVARDGGDSLTRALTTLHKIEMNNADLRFICKRYIAQIETLRAQLDELWMAAAAVRSTLIKENGCNGLCEKRNGRG